MSPPIGIASACSALVMALTIHRPHRSMPSESSPSHFFWKEGFSASRYTVQHMRCNARASEPHCAHHHSRKVDAWVPLRCSSYTPSDSPPRRRFALPSSHGKHPTRALRTYVSQNNPTWIPRGPLGGETSLLLEYLLCSWVSADGGVS